jgi:glutamate-1-semialdehyde 2,1-aminomutase
VESINKLSQIAINQIYEAGKVAGIPLSITGKGSMFKVHFRETPPTTYRDCYEDADLKKIMNLFLESMYDEGVIMINSCSCVLSTVIAQKEIDLLSDAMLKSFTTIKSHLKA